MTKLVARTRDFNIDNTHFYLTAHGGADGAVVGFTIRDSSRDGQRCYIPALVMPDLLELLRGETLRPPTPPPTMWQLR